MADEDLPEFIGRDKSTLADPKGKPAPVFNQHPEIDGLEDEAPPRVAVYNPPEPGASHPKHAVLGPALRLDAAEHALSLASHELTQAVRHLRDCDLAMAQAEGAMARELPGPTPDQLLREHVNSELKTRADRVAHGLNPDARRGVSSPGNSELDRIAANRPRPIPGQMASPLRSNAPRRTI